MQDMPIQNIVLIDDDVLEHQMIARAILQDDRLRLECFLSCEAASDVLRTGYPDLILLDARLPPENSPEHSVRRIRQMGCTAPILLISAAELKQDDLGLPHVVKDRLSLPHVLEACRNAMGVKQTGAATQR